MTAAAACFVLLSRRRRRQRGGPTDGMARSTPSIQAVLAAARVLSKQDEEGACEVGQSRLLLLPPIHRLIILPP